MRRRVDTSGHAGHDDIAGLTQGVGECAGKSSPCRRCCARADDGDSLGLEQSAVSQHPQEGWRRIKRGQQRGEIAFAADDQLSPDPPPGSQFLLGLINAGDFQRLGATASASVVALW